jgi:hypothetical protein
MARRRAGVTAAGARQPMTDFRCRKRLIDR